MPINVNNQHGENITNVDGDYYHTETNAPVDNLAIGPRAQAVSTATPHQQVLQLRSVLTTMNLPHPIATQAQAELATLDTAITAQEDQGAIAHRVHRLTQFLIASGALAAAGQALVEPLSMLAGWLGEYGRPILQALGL